MNFLLNLIPVWEQIQIHVIQQSSLVLLYECRRYLTYSRFMDKAESALSMQQKIIYENAANRANWLSHYFHTGDKRYLHYAIDYPRWTVPQS